MMNNPRLSAANLSMGAALLLVVLSFGLGCRSYRQAKQCIVRDLNQALQRTVVQHEDLWLEADTIRAYARLQEVMGAPVRVSGCSRRFAEALDTPQLKDVASLAVHILKKGEAATAAAGLHEVPDGCVAGDTLICLSTAADAGGLTLSFRGYARCSAGLILSLSRQTLPAALLGAAVLCGVFSLVCHRRRRAGGGAAPSAAAGEVITFGNLSLCMPEACFYTEGRERLKLTPMQYSLMEMFYLSSSHLLPKADICRSLWPGKENADETLYTLIRRLKPVVEENSNLKITTDRGRAYGLELKT